MFRKQRAHTFFKAALVLGEIAQEGTQDKRFTPRRVRASLPQKKSSTVTFSSLPQSYTNWKLFPPRAYLCTLNLTPEMSFAASNLYPLAVHMKTWSIVVAHLRHRLKVTLKLISNAAEKATNTRESTFNDARFIRLGAEICFVLDDSQQFFFCSFLLCIIVVITYV